MVSSGKTHIVNRVLLFYKRPEHLLDRFSVFKWAQILCMKIGIVGAHCVLGPILGSIFILPSILSCRVLPGSFLREDRLPRTHSKHLRASRSIGMRRQGK